MRIVVNPWVAQMKGYVPGEQLNDPEVIKLNTNESPYPPAPQVAEAVIAETERGGFNKYPDPVCTELRAAVAGRLGVSPEEIVCGNGSDESLRMLVHAFTKPGDVMATCNPTYTLYSVLAEMFGVTVENHPSPAPDYSLPDSLIEAQAKILFLPNPNPPIGTFYSAPDLEVLAVAEPDRLVVIDEAYVDFAPVSAVEIYKKYENVVITRTFSKSYSLAGLRAGFVVCRPELAETLNKIRDSYNMNRLTQAAALAAWNATEYYADRNNQIKTDRAWLAEELKDRGFTIPASEGNFLFARRAGAAKLYQALKERKILVRYFDLPGLNDGLRITVGTREQLEKLLAALDELS